MLTVSRRAWWLLGVVAVPALTLQATIAAVVF
jgi:hypothetical protein